MVTAIDLPPEGHRLQPDHLPTPFSAEQIRAGCPLGRTMRLREDVPGADPTYRQVRFVEVDAEGATQEHVATDADWRPIGKPTRRRSSWLDLQRHASMPAASTQVEATEVQLPFGRFAAWRFTRTSPGGEVRFWFAPTLAGMPALVEEWAAGALVGRTTMVGSRVEA